MHCLEVLKGLNDRAVRKHEGEKSKTDWSMVDKIITENKANGMMNWAKVKELAFNVEYEVGSRTTLAIVTKASEVLGTPENMEDIDDVPIDMVSVPVPSFIMDEFMANMPVDQVRAILPFLILQGIASNAMDDMIEKYSPAG